MECGIRNAERGIPGRKRGTRNMDGEIFCLTVVNERREIWQAFGASNTSDRRVDIAYLRFFHLWNLRQIRLATFLIISFMAKTPPARRMAGQCVVGWRNRPGRRNPTPQGLRRGACARNCITLMARARGSLRRRQIRRRPGSVSLPVSAKATAKCRYHDIWQTDEIARLTFAGSRDLLTGRSTLFGLEGDSTGLRPPVASSQSAM
jgi:hypothetical protein